MKGKWKTTVMATGLLAGSLSLAPSPVFAANHPLTVVVEKQTLQADVQPQIIKDRTFVPLYALAKYFGATVEYQPQERTVTVSKGALTFTIDMRSGEVRKNGIPVSLNPGPQIIQNRTMVPLRYFAEAFGYELQYQQANSTVEIVPSPALLEQRQKIKDILLKAQQAGNAQDSYAIQLQAQASSSAGASALNLKENLHFDYNKNPLTLHGKGTIQAGTTDQQQTVDIELYIQNGNVYFLNPQTKQWTKFSFMSANEWSQLVQWTTAFSASPLQEASLNLILPVASLEEEGNLYKISYILDQEKMAELMKNLPLPSNVDQKQLNESLSMYKQFQVTSLIDKSTYLEQGFTVQAEINIPGSQDSVLLTETGSISAYGQVPPIQIPQEALQAKEATTPPLP